MKIEEFNIPVPWGHIAVKTWGQPCEKPILLAHGGMDNAASFDRLIPLLPNSFYYICIDAPGHGKSSSLPQFVPLHFLDSVLSYKLVLDYFKRGKYILIGHSIGAVGVSYFARLYPEYVEKVIGIDPAGRVIPVEHFANVIRKNFAAYLKLQEKLTSEKRPTYTEEEAVERIMNRHSGIQLPVEAAVNLTKRILIPAGNGEYYLSTDQRLKCVLPLLHDIRFLNETLSLYPIICPYLVILCKTSASLLLTDTVKTLKEIEKWKKSKIVWVDSGHDVHMTNPEMIAPLISEFLLHSEAKL